MSAEVGRRIEVKHPWDQLESATKHSEKVKGERIREMGDELGRCIDGESEYVFAQ